MHGPEKPQTATSTNNTPTRPQPRTGRPPGWMDGWTDSAPAFTLPAVPSRLVSSRRGEPHRHPQHPSLSAPRVHRRAAYMASCPARAGRPAHFPLPSVSTTQAIAEPDCAASAHPSSDQIDRLPEGLGPETDGPWSRRRALRAAGPPLHLDTHSPPSSLLRPGTPRRRCKLATCPVQSSPVQLQFFYCVTPRVSRWAHQPAP